MDKAIGLLVAHGSKSESWKEPFIKIEAYCIESLPDYNWKLCYLERTTPSLNDAPKEINDNHPECRKVHIFPLFLAEGKHIKVDLPNFLNSVSQEYPNIQWILEEAIGTQSIVQKAIVSSIQNELTEPI